MKLETLIKRLEAADYLFVTVVAEHYDHYILTAFDSDGRPVDIEAMMAFPEGDVNEISLVFDKIAGSDFWDIMFIGEESFI